MHLGVASARGWLHSLFVYDVAEKQRILRAATAKGYGLPPEEFARPFPPFIQGEIAVSDSTMATPPAAAPSGAPIHPGRRRRWHWWLLIASLVGAGGTGATYPIWGGKPSPPPQQKTADQVFDIPWEIQDGRMKIGTLKRVR